MSQSNGGEIERLIGVMAKLPGLGPRSARRAVLYLIRHREKALQPLTAALTAVSERVKPCSRCGNIDSADPCRICTDPKRDDAILCVVEDVADLWALERGGIFKGRYHVLGGTLSALDGVTPEDLRIGALLARIAEGSIGEVILATNATVDGQTTAHYIADQLSGRDLKVTSLAQGVPLGGELDYLDDGTLAAAFSARKLMD